MKKIIVAGVAMGCLRLFSGAVAKLLTPTVKIADTRPAVDLAKAIPLQFGDWEEDRAQVSSVVNPSTEAALKAIYAQTLSRTYVNREGERIMLSIAYGTDQSDNLSVHFPEGCYVGQGFGVTPTAFEPVRTGFGDIPSARLVANIYTRIEPVTYWIVVGDKVVTTSWDMKKVKLAYSLKGLIPDATLMRVSAINPDTAAGYRLQQQFVDQMLKALTPAQRLHFAGLTH